MSTRDADDDTIEKQPLTTEKPGAGATPVPGHAPVAGHATVASKKTPPVDGIAPKVEVPTQDAHQRDLEAEED